MPHAVAERLRGALERLGIELEKRITGSGPTTPATTTKDGAEGAAIIPLRVRSSS